MAERLSTRALNRALLARQGLLEPWAIPPVEAVERLVGLQAQAPQAHYAGLFARLERCDPAAISRLIEDRALVRIVLMRGTIFLVSARDALALRPLVAPVLDRQLRGNWLKRMGEVERGDVAAAARELMAAGPLTFAELGGGLAERWPGEDGQALAMAARAWVPLVQTPPRGLWRRSGAPRHVPAEDWLGSPLGPASPAALEAAVLRYLAAYGPASVRDVQTWSGLTGLRTVLDGLRPRLRAFAGPGGTELLDVPDGPRPDPETPAPVRFLPEYENVMFSFADRSRIIAEEHRERVFTRGALLVDGFVAGAWRREPGRGSVRLEVEPFRRLGRAERAAMEAERERVRAFLHDAPTNG